MPQTDSPFRYPGGKTQLYQFISFLLHLNQINGTYIEPFGGGAGVAIKLLVNSKVDVVWINDYDTSIYSVWYYILNKPDELINLIEGVPFDYANGHMVNKHVSIDFWNNQHNYYVDNKDQGKSLRLAFATLMLNRTNRSGIIEGGPLGGHSQSNTTQIFARFNKKSLIGKIKLIHRLRKHIILTDYDANNLIPIIKKGIDPKNSFIFFDPPYFKQGRKLYFNSFTKDEHKLLSHKIMTMQDYYWITTYDYDQHIIDYFKRNKQSFYYSLRYSANNKKRGKALELLFASPKLNIESHDKVHLTPLVR